MALEGPRRRVRAIFIVFAGLPVRCPELRNRDIRTIRNHRGVGVPVLNSGQRKAFALRLPHLALPTQVHPLPLPRCNVHDGERGGIPGL
eukprot:SAG31_NODE_1450_length_8307_cov_3.676657_8_plen_89_part_00